MSKNKYMVLAFLVIAAAAYLLFFSGLMPKKTRVVFVSGENVVVRKLCSDFNRENSDIKLDYIAKSGYDGQKYVAEHKVDAWLSFYTSSIYYANREYSFDHENSELFDKFTNIGYSPMILAGARERFENKSVLKVSDIYEAVVNKAGWDKLGGDPKWGSFRFAFPDPYTNDSGADFLSLLIYQYYNSTGDPKSELTSYDVQREAATGYLRPFLENAGLHGGYVYSLLDNFRDVGRPGIDIGVMYENEFFESFQENEGDWQKVKILYPEPGISRQLVLARLKAASQDPKKAGAVDRFEKYLLSEEAQESILSLGYRPMKPSTATRELIDKKYKSYGILLDPPKPENPIQPSTLYEIQKVSDRYIKRGN